MKAIRRTIHPEVRIVDEKRFIAEFVASTETIDSYNEVIRADGWLFSRVQKNFPLVNSHDYSDIRNTLGKIIDYSVKGGKLMNTAQYACEVQENQLAMFAWKMLVAKFLPAVSVGFAPITYACRWDSDKTKYDAQCSELQLSRDCNPNVIYITQEQLELSQCVIGANPDAVAKAYKAGAITDADLDFLSTEQAKSKIADSTDSPAAVEKARQRVRTALLMEFTTKIKRL